MSRCVYDGSDCSQSLCVPYAIEDKLVLHGLEVRAESGHSHVRAAAMKHESINVARLLMYINPVFFDSWKRSSAIWM